MTLARIPLLLLAVAGCDPSTPAAKPTEPAKSKPPAAVVVQPADPVPPKPAAPTPGPFGGPSKPGDDPDKKEDPPEEPPPVPFKPFKGKFWDFEKQEEKEGVIEGLYFEVAKDGTRRVHVMAEVCLREGFLEMFLCRNNTKEHESILRTPVDPAALHACLEVAGAKPGSTAKFTPRFKAPTGTPIKIALTYRAKGKVVTAPAQDWVNEKKTGKPLAADWVFAGSRWFEDPEEPQKKPYYLARNGEVVCLANFPDAMLDLPIKSPKEDADRLYEIQTTKIPPLLTKVLVTFEPVKKE